MKNNTYFNYNDVTGALKSVNLLSGVLKGISRYGSDGAKLPEALKQGDYILNNDVPANEEDLFEEMLYVIDEECDLQNWFSVSVANGIEVILGKN